MNNLQFIATYILNNPGKTRYNEIIRNLMLWKGFSANDIAIIGGQYSRYFTEGHMRTRWWGNGKVYRTGGYKNILWEKIDKNNRQSGFKLTEKGMTYVVKGE